MIAPCSTEQMRMVTEYFEYRFGLAASVFAGYSFYSGSNGRVFIGPAAMVDLEPVETVGILVARVGRGVKPSSLMFQVFGRYVTANVISLSREQVRRYLAGGAVELSPEMIGSATDGFVMLSYRDQPVACGLLKGTTVKNVLPKEMWLHVDLL